MSGLVKSTVLGAVLLTGTALAAQAQSVSASPPAGGAAASPARTKIGLVNMAKVLKRYEKGNQVVQQLQDLRNGYVAQVNKKRAEIADAQKQMEKLTLPAEKEKLEAYIPQLTREIQDIDKKAQKELGTLSNDTLVQVYKEIKSVIVNLVVNALDSMEEGGTLAISLGMRDGMAELVFQDTGCGMTGEVLENIFEPFYTRSRTGKGTGLEWLASVIRTLALSADESQVATGSEDETVRIWNTRTGTLLSCLRGHENTITSLAFAPDGQRVASGSKDATLRIWAVSAGRLLACCRGHLGAVLSVAFAPDGQRVASGSWDGTVRIWDSSTGRE